MKIKVEDYDLDPNDPLDLLFVEVDELSDIYTLQKNELTEKQLIEMAYVVIERAKAFKKDLREWNRKEEIEQTWINFKKHFRNAQQELRTSGDLTIQDAMSKNELINVVTESINSVIQQNKEEEENKENIETINAVTNEKEDIKKNRRFKKGNGKHEKTSATAISTMATESISSQLSTKLPTTTTNVQPISQQLQS